MNPSYYGQLIFNNGDNSIKWSKNSFFNKWCWEFWTATCKKLTYNHKLSPFTKVNSSWVKDLNISCDTIKAVGEIIGRKTSDIPCSNIFTDIFPTGRDIKERIHKWGTTSN